MTEVKCGGCGREFDPSKDEKSFVQTARDGEFIGATCGKCMNKANAIADTYADPLN